MYDKAFKAEGVLLAAIDAAVAKAERAVFDSFVAIADMPDLPDGGTIVAFRTILDADEKGLLSLPYMTHEQALSLSRGLRSLIATSTKDVTHPEG